ncbi:MAG TPA: trypsin-like peptidase domain-containing protein [Chloroflexota bacterium]|nr:trypsin-like peptidase domain-containing protein [Chloroflexota bacterium]
MIRIVAVTLVTGLLIPATWIVPARAAILEEGRPQVQSPAVSDSQTIIDVYQRASPSVVNITYSTETRDILGRRVRTESTGSGVVVDQLGHVITNQHVVSDATHVDVTLADRSSYVGNVVATDRANDLALLQINAPEDVLQSLTVANLGDSSQLQVGEIVVAIGNPYGLDRSASLGIISSLGRSRPGVESRLISNMIQTDAAINPGNSGGPLLNLDGEVVGINEQIEGPSEGNVGIGFAIPINTVKRYLPDLLAGKEPTHAWLGIAGVSLTPTRSQTLGLSTKQGVIVAAVASDGPAAAAGIRGVQGNDASTADIILALDGHTVRSFQDIAAYIDQLEPGQAMLVQYVRGGDTESVSVTLGTWQPQNATAY